MPLSRGRKEGVGVYLNGHLLILAVVEPQPLPIMLLNFLGILREGEVLSSWLDKGVAGGHENKKNR